MIIGWFHYNTLFIENQYRKEKKHMKLREKCWLWGHPEGCYNNMYGNDKVSRMTPMEFCLYLGIHNTFMVPDGEHRGVTVNRRQYNKAFKTLYGVGWECYDATANPEKIEPFIAEAADFPNINRVVLDDFQRGGKYKNIPIENLWKIHERLHNNEVRPLAMWMVLYKVRVPIVQAHSRASTMCSRN